MLMLQDLALSEPAVCPYIPSEKAVNLYFIAARLDEKELNGILERGWRKFGWYYFRPACGGCERCTPLRVLTRRFEPTKSQRRVIRKNAGVEVRFSDLRYRDEIYEVYLEHSRARFQAAGSPEDFLLSFYNPSCPAIQSEYYKDGRLVGVGFLDRHARGPQQRILRLPVRDARAQPGNLQRPEGSRARPLPGPPLLLPGIPCGGKQPYGLQGTLQAPRNLFLA